MAILRGRRRRWRDRATTVTATSLAVVALALGTTSTAAAQIIRDPTGNVEIGTTSGDNPGWSTVAIANGGCASGTIAVGAGGCTPTGTISIGLGGSGAYGDIAITDSGDAETPGCGFVCRPHVAVTGGGGSAGCGGVTMIGVNLGDGCATGGTFAFGNSGHANSATLAIGNSGNASGPMAVSVTGTAGRSGSGFYDDATNCYGDTGVSVSVTADACTRSGIAVAPNGDAYESGSGVAVGTGSIKRSIMNAPEGGAGTNAYFHTGLNAVKDAYQTAIVATAPPVDPLKMADKTAQLSKSAACVNAQLATGLTLPKPSGPAPAPPSNPDCLVEDLRAEQASESSSSAQDEESSTDGAPFMYPWAANHWLMTLQPGYEDGCVPQMAKTVYWTNSLPSQKRLYDEMGTRRAGGTTLDTGAAVIRRYFKGKSPPVASFVDDADTVMNRVVTALLSWYQGTIIGLDPGMSHWPGSETTDGVQYHYGAHAVGTWGYWLGGGGYLWLVDGFDYPPWGNQNPWGYNHFVELAKVWAAMQANSGEKYGEMIW